MIEINGGLELPKNVAEYDISLSGQTETTNYTYTYVGGKLKINPIELSVILKDTITGKKYDGVDEFTNLQNPDLYDFNTYKVTNTKAMFKNCTVLTTIYATTNFVTTNITESTDMFAGSTNIIGGMGTEYSNIATDKVYARIDQGIAMSGYFTKDKIYAVLLSDKSDEANVPNEFRVHHGSLSKVERESVEHELQQGQTPITALCTSTLELGVDIGKVKSIAQIGKANSVSGLRQRLGRSGRRNEPSILRVFSVEYQAESGGLILFKILPLLNSCV